MMTLPLVERLNIATTMFGLSRSVSGMVNIERFGNINPISIRALLLKGALRLDLPPADKLYWGTLAP